MTSLDLLRLRQRFKLNKMNKTKVAFIQRLFETVSSLVRLLNLDVMG